MPTFEISGLFITFMVLVGWWMIPCVVIYAISQFFKNRRRNYRRPTYNKYHF